MTPPHAGPRPHAFGAAEVAAARARIAGHVRITPVLAADPDLLEEGWLKLELLQHSGSFKVRGAFNRLLAARERGELDKDVGIAVASGGNAALANAYAAAQLDVPVTVFVPEAAPRFKVEKLRSLRARVALRGSEYAHAYEAAMEHVAKTGALYCHAYDQPEIAAGAGTLGLELVEQTQGRLDTVLVAVGGGGLMAGVASAVEQVARVVGVEPEGAPTLHAALAAGAPTDVSVSGVAADSLGARRIGDIAFDVAVRSRVTSVLVPDQALVDARALLWRRWRIPVEHGAAAALAALTTGAYVPRQGERVAVVLCGANTDPSTLEDA